MDSIIPNNLDAKRMHYLQNRNICNAISTNLLLNGMSKKAIEKFLKARMKLLFSLSKYFNNVIFSINLVPLLKDN